MSSGSLLLSTSTAGSQQRHQSLSAASLANHRSDPSHAGGAVAAAQRSQSSSSAQHHGGASGSIPQSPLIHTVSAGEGMGGAFASSSSSQHLHHKLNRFFPSGSAPLPSAAPLLKTSDSFREAHRQRREEEERRREAELRARAKDKEEMSMRIAMMLAGQDERRGRRQTEEEGEEGEVAQQRYGQDHQQPASSMSRLQSQQNSQNVSLIAPVNAASRSTSHHHHPHHSASAEHSTIQMGMAAGRRSADTSSSIHHTTSQCTPTRSVSVGAPAMRHSTDVNSVANNNNGADDDEYQQYKRKMGRIGIACPSPDRPTHIMAMGGGGGGGGGFASPSGEGESASTPLQQQQQQHRRAWGSSSHHPSTHINTAAAPTNTSTTMGGNNKNSSETSPPMSPREREQEAKYVKHVAMLQHHLDEAVAVAEGQQTEIDKLVEHGDDAAWRHKDAVMTMIAEHDRQMADAQQALAKADGTVGRQQDHIIELTAMVRRLQSQLEEAYADRDDARRELAVERQSNTQLAAYVAQLNKRVGEARAEACEWKRVERAKMLAERMAYEAKANEALREALLIGVPSSSSSSASPLNARRHHDRRPDDDLPPSLANPLLLSQVESLAGQKAVLEAMVAEREEALEQLTSQVAERRRLEAEAAADKAREEKEASDRRQWEMEYEAAQALQRQRAAEREQRRAEVEAQLRLQEGLPAVVRESLQRSAAHHSPSNLHPHEVGGAASASTTHHASYTLANTVALTSQLDVLRGAFREEVERSRVMDRREAAGRVLDELHAVVDGAAAATPQGGAGAQHGMGIGISAPAARPAPSIPSVLSPIRAAQPLPTSRSTTHDGSSFAYSGAGADLSAASPPPPSVAGGTADPLLDAYVADAAHRIQRHKADLHNAAADEQRRREERLAQAEAAAASHEAVAMAHKAALVAKDNEVASLNDSVRRYQSLLERASTAITTHNVSSSSSAAAAVYEGTRRSASHSSADNGGGGDGEAASRAKYSKLLEDLANAPFAAARQPI